MTKKKETIMRLLNSIDGPVEKIIKMKHFQSVSQAIYFFIVIKNHIVMCSVTLFHMKGKMKKVFKNENTTHTSISTNISDATFFVLVLCPFFLFFVFFLFFFFFVNLFVVSVASCCQYMFSCNCPALGVDRFFNI